MGRVERFEDLIAWQKARELTKQIYLLTKKEKFSRDFGLRDQIKWPYKKIDEGRAWQPYHSVLSTQSSVLILVFAVQINL